ncbi:hypothetical protein Pcinc_009561 [Petrolisthes cinctipes]|uniref:Uncharacterized protein n=1 Tax=Petrolisthes cinctipes TaxID=88211 RepID=A0AAE1GAY4_PETCI|nr:hypothetical protein Pcinc_009561 [Petrolisthes cinctipes]
MTALPQIFTATRENRRWLVSVAVGGEKTPLVSFFRGLLEPQVQSKEESELTSCTHMYIETYIQDQPAVMEADKTSEGDEPYTSKFVTDLQNLTGKYGNADTVDSGRKTAKS